MKIDFIKHIIKQVFCWMIFLQVINLSIHPKHFTPYKSSSVAGTEQLTMNEVNSVYELIAEGVFETEVPESEEDEIDSSSPPLELYLSNGTCGQLPPIAFFVEHFSHYQNTLSLVRRKPHSPPPKFLS